VAVGDDSPEDGGVMAETSWSLMRGVNDKLAKRYSHTHSTSSAGCVCGMLMVVGPQTLAGV